MKQYYQNNSRINTVDNDLPHQNIYQSEHGGNRRDRDLSKSMDLNNMMGGPNKNNYNSHTSATPNINNRPHPKFNNDLNYTMDNSRMDTNSNNPNHQDYNYNMHKSMEPQLLSLDLKSNQLGFNIGTKDYKRISSKYKEQHDLDMQKQMNYKGYLDAQVINHILIVKLG